MISYYVIMISTWPGSLRNNVMLWLCDLKYGKYILCHSCILQVDTRGSLLCCLSVLLSVTPSVPLSIHYTFFVSLFQKGTHVPWTTLVLMGFRVFTATRWCVMTIFSFSFLNFLQSVKIWYLTDTVLACFLLEKCKMHDKCQNTDN